MQRSHKPLKSNKRQLVETTKTRSQASSRDLPSSITTFNMLVVSLDNRDLTQLSQFLSSI